MGPEPLDAHDLLATGAAVAVRAADPARDAIDGALPRAVVIPHSAEAVAATLAWASERRFTVVIRGGGSRLGWGRPATGLDLIVDMRGLNRLVAHQAGDLTATVEAGITLDELNDALCARGQWLPLDPPFSERTTIGGLLATNDSGPHRHRFGTPRDLVIGIQLATVDGRLAKAGGQVVKNVAGYDLSKLVSGSFGGLAAIVGATFKLSPLPEGSATVAAGPLDADALAEIVERIAASDLDPIAFEFQIERDRWSSGAISCLVRFASVAAAVDDQVRTACGVLGGAVTPRVLTGDEEAETWRRHGRGVWDASGAVVRASWLPAEIGAALGGLESMGPGVRIEAVGRAMVGSGLIRIDGDTAAQAAAIERLRASTVFGNVLVVRAASELKARVDVWPPVPNRALLSSLKRALDPQGILGAGRGPFP